MAALLVVILSQSSDNAIAKGKVGEVNVGEADGLWAKVVCSCCVNAVEWALEGSVLKEQLAELFLVVAMQVWCPGPEDGFQRRLVSCRCKKKTHT